MQPCIGRMAPVGRPRRADCPTMIVALVLVAVVVEIEMIAVVARVVAHVVVVVQNVFVQNTIRKSSAFVALLV